MHTSKQKQTCPKCERDINIPNFNKHAACCDGRIEKKTEWVCEFCGKLFNNAHGYSGHKQRSHTQREKQSEYGSKGTPKRIELGSIGVGLYSHSDETKDKLSRIACERLSKHSKYTQNTEYKPGVILESSYEVRVAEILDKLGVEWERIRKGYIWDDNGKNRRYIPDFYLPKQNIFLDPKNDYLIKKDKRKIESAMRINNIKVVVLPDELINEEFIELMVL